MKLLIYDIETLIEMFLVGIYDPHENKYIEFEVSKSKYQLEQFNEFCEAHKDYYWVGFNNIRFDSQVVEFVLRKYENWSEKSNLEVASIIAQKAQDVIDDANFDVFAEYREDDLSLRQIDLFKIHHYDNKNRRVSLKRLQFEMDWENIEEMPIHHLKKNLTLEERRLTREYCKNDVMSTYEFYKVTIGETDHPLYKGNNQIQLRFDIEKEFGIPCMNYSDSKIGDEIIKKYYCEEKRIDPKLLPKKGFFRKTIHLKHCVAKYITFKSVQLDQFLKKIKNTSLGINDEFKERINFYGTVYSFMKGGLHTENKPEVFEADEDHLIIDFDVSSYYPAIIINNKQYPFHLGKQFLSGYIKMFEKRLSLKPLSKTDKKIKGIVNALKLSVNAVYG
jgi:DNA polymerase elongation subunit (family B)